MKKYPKVRRPGHPETDGLLADPDDDLVITEKFDGNNLRFTRDGDELQFGSRNCIIDNDPETVQDMFTDVVDYMQSAIDVADIRAMEKALGCESVTLFGENAVEHTISDYRWDEVPQFQLFDIWVGDSGHWLDWDSVCTHAETLGLQTVPEVERLDVADFDPSAYEIPPSVYRPGDGLAEGVVVRNKATGARAKMISEEFAEQHKSAKSKNYDEGDVGRFLDQHVTRRRIEKNVLKLIDSPKHDYGGPQMEMMPDLGPAVWEDVWAEDWADIIYESWELDLGDARSKTSSKTARVLNEIIRDQTVVDPGTGEVSGEYLDKDGDHQ